MIGTVPLMQLCLANFEVVVAPGSGEPFAAGRGSESCVGGCRGVGGVIEQICIMQILLTLLCMHAYVCSLSTHKF
jgi:hypothetical protein